MRHDSLKTKYLLEMAEMRILCRITESPCMAGKGLSSINKSVMNI